MTEQNLEDKTTLNMQMLRKSGFVFDSIKHEAFEIYRKGQSWVLYNPVEDQIMIEFYSANEANNELSRQRNTNYIKD